MRLCELAFWTLTLSAAVAGRFAGSWVGRRIGARHAVAWFGAVAGFSVAFLGTEAICYAWRYPDQSLGDWYHQAKSGPLPGSFIAGTVVAFIIEVLASAVEQGIRSSRPAADAGRSVDPRPERALRRSVIVVAVLGGLVFADYWVRFLPWLRWRRAYRRILSSVDGLAEHRPKDVTKGQWKWVVGWTHNAVCNCLSTPGYITDEQRYYRFADELEQRAGREVTLLTIDWIWDEFEGISRNGTSYSEKYRPTTPEHFREAGPMDFGGIDVP